MAPVILNVYDLTSQNNVLYWCGVGVFHTGVEVYGIEYAFGGHDYDVSGVFATNPREAPGAVLFRESLPMGETDLSPAQVQAVVQRLGQRFRGNRYHLLQMNCNHFANELTMSLVGRPAPLWVNRLAGLAVALHCLLPATWVPPLLTPSVDPQDADALLEGYMVARGAGAGSRSGKRRGGLAGRAGPGGEVNGVVDTASRQALMAGPRSDELLVEPPVHPLMAGGRL